MQKPLIYGLVLLSLLLCVDPTAATGETLQFAIDGHSMEPTLEDGQVVLVQNISAVAPLEIDQIYVYKPTWKSYTGNGWMHRLYWIFYVGDEVYYIFKGDHNDYFDVPAKRWQIMYQLKEKAPWV